MLPGLLLGSEIFYALLSWPAFHKIKIILRSVYAQVITAVFYCCVPVWCINFSSKLEEQLWLEILTWFCQFLYVQYSAVDQNRSLKLGNVHINLAKDQRSLTKCMMSLSISRKIVSQMICINTNMTTKSLGVSSIDNILLFEMTNKSKSKPIELLIRHIYFVLYYTLSQSGMIPNLLKHVLSFTWDWNFKIIKIMCVKCIVSWWLNRQTGRQHIMSIIGYQHFK